MAQAQHVGPYPERFEFKRLGDKPCDVTVSVDIDWQVCRWGGGRADSVTELVEVVGR